MQIAVEKRNWKFDRANSIRHGNSSRPGSRCPSFPLITRVAIRDPVARSLSFPFFFPLYIRITPILDLPGCPSKGNGREEEGTPAFEGTRGDG